MKPQSIAEAATLVKQAAANRHSIVVRGSGSKHDWGYQSDADLILETTALTGIVEHEPGDLVVVVRAGTPMSALQASLAQAGQQLALDTPHPHATVGGVVATNVSGPRRLRYGTARDLLIGITIVRPDGVVARAGGKVVKNVAGYDLGKLFVGSYGTLGLIAECAFRLHPLPSSSTVERHTMPDALAAAALAATLRLSPLAPTAIELDWPPAGPASLSVAFDGVPAWELPWAPGDLGIKLTAALSRLPVLLDGIEAASAIHGVPVHVRGSLGAGVFYAGVPLFLRDPDPSSSRNPADFGGHGDLDHEKVAGFVADVRAAAHAAGGHAVVLTAPAELRAGLDLWGPVAGLDIMRRIKRQFDPEGRFAPGRFVGGM